MDWFLYDISLRYERVNDEELHVLKSLKVNCSNKAYFSAMEPNFYKKLD